MPDTPQDKPVERYYRKIIKIRATDSPNVRYALAQLEAGIEPDNRMLVPGILSWDDYCKRRSTWSSIRQTIGLDAEFWEGADVLLYPPDWIARANGIHINLLGKPRQAKSMGIDSAEGGDKSTWAIGDEYGLLELKSMKTPDTTFITKHTKHLGKVWGIPSNRWIFDRGGGGKQHADRLRSEGYDCQTVGFGEAATPELKKVKGFTPYDERIENVETRYEYLNRRAELYGNLSKLLDPAYGTGYGIPPASTGPQYEELINQMSVIPKLLDGEGRMWMLPKRKKNKDSKIKSLVELIGHSPDELDAVVLQIWGLTTQAVAAVAGVAF